MLFKYKGVIYKWTCLVNQKVYVGQTTNENKRYYQFIHGYSYNDSVTEDIKKYGIDMFEYDVLEYIEDVDFDVVHKLLDEREAYWIATLRTTNDDYGYNLSEGVGKACQSSKQKNEELWKDPTFRLQWCYKTIRGFNKRGFDTTTLLCKLDRYKQDVLNECGQEVLENIMFEHKDVSECTREELIAIAKRKRKWKEERKKKTSKRQKDFINQPHVKYKCVLNTIKGMETKGYTVSQKMRDTLETLRQQIESGS